MIELEKLREEGLRDADTGVADLDFGRAVPLAQGDAHLAVLGSELDGIGEQIPDDLLQTLGVAVDDDVSRPELAHEGDPLAVRRWLRGGNRGLDDGVHLHRFRIQAELAGEHPGHVEQVVDQLRLRPGVAFDHLQPLAPGFGQLVFAQQHLRPAEDGIERRPQLVADDGEELVAGGVRLLRSLAFRLEQARPLARGEVGNHHAEGVRVLRRQAVERELHGHRIALGRTQPAFPVRYPRTCGLQERLDSPAGLGLGESVNGMAAHAFERVLQQIGEEPVAVEDGAVPGHGDGALLHLLDEDAKRLFGALECVDLLAVRAVHHDGVHFAAADGVESVLRLLQPPAEGCVRCSFPVSHCRMRYPGSRGFALR